MDFIAACRRAISIDSTPLQGNLEMASYCADLCKAAGLQTQLLETTYRGVSQANLIAEFPGTGPIELLLASHLDTVDPGSYGLWTLTDRSPFNATIRDGKIYGLGAADGKLDFLCKIQAAEELRGRGLKKRFALVGTFGEELGLQGMRALMKTQSLRARYALVGEPSELDLIYASNGSVIIDFSLAFSQTELELQREHNEKESTSSHSRIFLGKAAHSSTPQLGENAIMKMLRYLNELPEGVLVLSMDGGTAHNVIPDQATLEVDLNYLARDGVRQKLNRIIEEIEGIALDFLKYPAEGFVPATPTFNIGVIRTVEDAIELVLSIRITPSVTEEILQGWRQRLRKKCEDEGAKMSVRNIIPPTQTEKNGMFVQNVREELRQLGHEPRMVTRTSSNEASILSSYGIECLGFGPGQSEGNSHSPNEYNEVAQLEKATALYRRLIERLCS